MKSWYSLLVSQSVLKLGRPRRQLFHVAGIGDVGLRFKTKTALTERGYKRLSTGLSAIAFPPEADPLMAEIFYAFKELSQTNTANILNPQ